MAPVIRNRPIVAALTAGATSLLVSAGAMAADSLPEHCIVGINAIGCVDQLTIDQLTAGVDDPGTLRQQLEQQIGAGTCTIFEYGERVFVARSDSQGHTAVRRPDDSVDYWMPSAWSRPGEECRRNASQANLDRKIGLPSGRSDLMPAERPPAQALVQGIATPARPATCVFKPVMTDAEIAACRNSAH
jgi:hypothetical protein